MTQPPPWLGELHWDAAAYPSGFPGFTDKLHKMGIKFGSVPTLPAARCPPALPPRAPH
jgi:hypothetical protein